MRRAARPTSGFIALSLLAACGTTTDAPGDPGADAVVDTAFATAATLGPGSTSAPPVTSSVPSATTPPTTPASSAAELIEGMVLHLPDVRPGATIGDDSGCGVGISFEGDDNEFQDLVVSIRGDVAHCLNQLEAPDTVVDSLAVVFPDEPTATAAMDPTVFEWLIGYFAVSCCSSEDRIEPFVAAGAPGEQAWEFPSDGDDVAMIAWRTGAAIGALIVRHSDGRDRALVEGRRLAALQADRMLAPGHVDPEIDDDSRVAADRASFDIWWLGDAAAAPGSDLVRFSMADGDSQRVTFNYDGSLVIENLDLSTIVAGDERRQMIDIADELFDSPCTVTEALDHPDGEAVLLGRFVPAEFFGPPTTERVGWGSLMDETCPAGDPNVWMVAANFGDGTLVRIGAPLCYFCLGLAPPEGDPAASAIELRSVVEQLERYEPNR